MAAEQQTHTYRMKQRPSLTKRQRQVLVAVIREHVKSASPVGSSVLARNARLGIGSASIRRAMAELEELGYLSHPHTSAGRVPTEVGYRTYVDWLMRPVRLEEIEAFAIEERLKQARGGTEEVVVQACRVLSTLSKQLALATRPLLVDTPIERVELVALAPDRLLLAVMTRAGVVRTAIVETEQAVSARHAQAAGHILNTVMKGLTPREVLVLLEGEPLLPVDPPLGPALTRVTGRLMHSMDLGVLHFEGTGYVLAQPEFVDGTRLRGLMGALEERSSLVRELVEHTESGGSTIVIGKEHHCRGMDCVSVVSSRYRIGNASGVVAVLGPTRMWYNKLVPMVEGVATAITRVLGE
jgi:heat-inducible transcriptional repressor